MLSVMKCGHTALYPAKNPKGIFFAGYTNEMMRTFRKASGIPDYINASYNGYSGPKKFKFPTDINLDLPNYPDITDEVIKLKTEIVNDLKVVKKGPLGVFKELKLFLKNFPTGNCWDTKYLPEFPGRDIKGQTQYGIYKNKIVSANYVSNNIYGQACAAMGLSSFFAKVAAKLDAAGILELLTKKKIPDKNLIKFRDTDCDQKAIVSGIMDFLKDSPWAVKNIDPSMPHPVNSIKSGLFV